MLITKFIQNIDYLANPAIRKKNSYVAKWLINNQVDRISEGADLYDILIEKIRHLTHQCYDQKPRNTLDEGSAEIVKQFDKLGDKLMNENYEVMESPLMKKIVVRLLHLPYGIPRTDQLLCFTTCACWKDENLKEYLFGSPFEKAYFLYRHALEFNYKFICEIRHVFRRTSFLVTGGIKSNLIRIAQKIESNDFELEGPFRVTDMLRATVKVETI